MDSTIVDVAMKLLAYCQANDWAGWDPYDALNSRLFQQTPFYKSKIFRLMLTQGMKYLPINIRRLLLIPKTQNPKALALFLMSFVKLKKLGLLANDDLIHQMMQRLATLRSVKELSDGRATWPTVLRASKRFTVSRELATVNPYPPTNQIDQKDQIDQTDHFCWGYSFPWQGRSVLVPRGEANLVCTVFVAHALLNAYEKTGDYCCLKMAVGAAEYLLKKLYWTEGDSAAGFSYPLPSLRVRVHNANLLGAALLCRVYRQTGEKRFLDPALMVARYSAGQQREDGSWPYGEHPTQRWVDNFHTGYNLCALRAIGRYGDTSEFEHNVRRGFEFYRNHFFRQDGAPRYFHDRTYPIDIHSVAQSIITLVEFRDIYTGSAELARSVLTWAMARMWDDRGYFYYQMHPHYTNRIPYMRWSQAWMLLALATFLERGAHYTSEPEQLDEPTNTKQPRGPR